MILQIEKLNINNSIHSFILDLHDDKSAKTKVTFLSFPSAHGKKGFDD